MGKPLVFSRCSDSERAAVEELIEEYHRGDIRSFDVLSVRVHQRIGIHVSKSTIRRIYQRMFGEEQKERCGREKENNERILAELFDQYKRGEKSSWRQMAIRAQEAGISTSKSTLFRRFKKEQDDDRVRSMTIGSIAKTDESEEQNEPFVERISLSRHLRATLLNVYEDGGLRQYSLIRGDISTGRQYYRCTRCAEWKKKRSEGKIAYISVVKGRIVSQSGAHHPSCEPLDENKVFAKAVDRQCRLDVRKEGTNPRLSYTKGIQRMMGTNLNACSYFPPWNTVRRAYYRHRIKGSGQTPSPSPTTSDSQGTVDGRVTEVIHGENGQPQISQVSSSVGPTSQRLLVDGDADLMVPRLNMSEERWHTDDEGQGSVKTEPEESNFKREEEQTSEAARRSSTFVMRTRQVGSKPTAGYERRTTGNSCGRMVSRVVGIKRLQREKRPVRIRYTVGNYLQHRIHQSVESSRIGMLLTEIRELRTSVRQHESRIRQLEEQLADKELVVT